MAYRKLDKLEPNFRNKVQMFMKKCKSEWLDIFITETWRSQARQIYLRLQWLSKIWRSKHQDWLAIDIAFRWKELYPKDNKLWEKVYKVAEYCWIDSWYVLWGWDKPHYQDNGAKFIPEVKAKLSLEERRFRRNLEDINSGLWNMTSDKVLQWLLAGMNKYLRWARK